MLSEPERVQAGITGRVNLIQHQRELVFDVRPGWEMIDEGKADFDHVANN